MVPIRELGASAKYTKKEDLPPISYRHFRRSPKRMNPSVAQGDLAIYEEWNDTYGNKCGKDCDDSENSDDDNKTPGV